MKKIILLALTAIILSACLFGLFSKTPKGFVLVEGGQFTMSNNTLDTFQVQLSSYYLAEKEVSMESVLIWANSVGVDDRGYYKAFQIFNSYLGTYESPYVFEDSLWVANSVPNHRLETASAIFITWFGACLYCNWLSNASGRDSVYTINGTNISADHSKNGYRLPTEAEWEYAATEGAKSENLYCGTNNLDSLIYYAWYYPNALQVSPADFQYGVHPSGEKLPNGLGLYDMSGNVVEWTWDWYAFYDQVAVVDPMGPASGDQKACRGGGWDLSANMCEAKERLYTHPNSTYLDLGFRMAISVIEN